MSSSKSFKTIINYEFQVDGITCTNCTNSIEKAIRENFTLKGLIDVNCALLTHELKVVFQDLAEDSASVDSQSVCDVIENIGYGCKFITSK